MWAAWRNKVDMVLFLLEHDADINILNYDGDNALDVAVKRMSYNCALIFKQKGLELKDTSYYEQDLAVEFDLPLFLQYLEEDKQINSTAVFFEKIKRKEAELAKKDMIIDPRQSWKNWFKRTLNFEEPPMIERNSIPENQQPHNSLFGKYDNISNGINPYPPGHKWNKSKTMKVKPTET